MELKEIHRNCMHAQITNDIKKHSYCWLSTLATHPCLSLALYRPNHYLVGVLQHHQATVINNGNLIYWKYVESDYCMRLYDHFKVGNYHYLITDPVVGGCVSDELAHPDELWDALTMGGGGGDIYGVSRHEDLVRDLAYHLLRALSDLHCAGFAHLNLNWDCVWLDRNQHAMLGGFSNLTPVQRPHEAVLGHPLFHPPEALHGSPFSEETLTKVDMWQLGVMVLEALTGDWIRSHAHLGRGSVVSPSRLLKDIESYLPCLAKRLIGFGITTAAADFVIQLLRMEPCERPDAADMLGHQWIESRERPREFTLPYNCNVGFGVNAEINASSQLTMDETGKEIVKKKPKEPKGFNLLAEQLSTHGYLLEKVIRQGKQGSWILLARNFENRQVAIKRKPVRMCARGEWKHWPTLSHPNILDILDVFRSGQYLFFVTEWVNQQDVQTIMFQRKNEVAIGPNEMVYRGITVGVLRALNYLHGHGFAHLDVSWKHVLLDTNGHIYLCGFASLRSIFEQTQNSLGNPALRAPESMHHGRTMRTNLPKLDMWSLGAALLQGLLNKSIAGKTFASHFDQFDCNITYQQQMENIAALPILLEKSNLSVQAQHFLQRLLNFQPERRPTAGESLHDPWIMAELVDNGFTRGEFSQSNTNDMFEHSGQDMCTTTQAVECTEECPLATPQICMTTISQQACPGQQHECFHANQYLQPLLPADQTSFSDCNNMTSLMAEHKWQSPLKMMHGSTLVRPFQKTIGPYDPQRSTNYPSVCSPCETQVVCQRPQPVVTPQPCSPCETQVVCQRPQPCSPPLMKKIQPPIQHRATTSMPCKPPGDPCPLPAQPCPKVCQPKEQPCLVPCQVPKKACEELCEQAVLLRPSCSTQCSCCSQKTPKTSQVVCQKSCPMVIPQPCPTPLMKRIQPPIWHNATTNMPCKPPSNYCPLPAKPCPKVCQPKQQPCQVPCQLPEEPCEKMCEQQVLLPNPNISTHCSQKRSKCPPMVINRGITKPCLRSPQPHVTDCDCFSRETYQWQTMVDNKGITQPYPSSFAILRTPTSQHRATTSTPCEQLADSSLLPARPCPQIQQPNQPRRLICHATQKLCRHQVSMLDPCKPCRRFL